MKTKSNLDELQELETSRRLRIQIRCWLATGDCWL